MGTSNFIRNNFSYLEFSDSYEDLILSDIDFLQDTKDFSDEVNEELAQSL